MAFLKTFSFLFLGNILFLSACTNNSKESTNDSNTEQQKILLPADINKTPSLPNNTNTTQTTPPPVNQEPAQNSDGIWHFTCSNGCTGGAGSAENCKTCGTLLVHNASYHNQDPNTTMPQQNIPTPETKIVIPDQNTPEPAQNATGIWHYTCEKGCPGGAGTATACVTCGTTLAHNTAYHQ